MPSSLTTGTSGPSDVGEADRQEVGLDREARFYTGERNTQILSGAIRCEFIKIPEQRTYINVPHELFLAYRKAGSILVMLRRNQETTVEKEWCGWGWGEHEKDAGGREHYLPSTHSLSPPFPYCWVVVLVWIPVLK